MQQIVSLIFYLKNKLMSILNSILKIFVGDKSKQDVKMISPIVKSILSFEEKVSQLSNDDLRAKTDEFKSSIANSTSNITDQIKNLESEVETTVDFDEKENLYNKIDDLKVYTTALSDSELIALTTI
jgi:preprotein translocase subunit SecA